MSEVKAILEEEGRRRRAAGEQLLKEHPFYIYAVTIDRSDAGSCRFCGGAIVRGKTVRGKGSWFDAEPDSSGRHANHWVTCCERRRAAAWSKTLGRSGHLPLGTP